MKPAANQPAFSGGEIVFYQTPDGQTRLECRFAEKTIWLTQRLMADLYQIGVNTVNHHIQEIYADGELAQTATIRQYRIVQTEGARQVERQVDHYSLDMILAVGYRVRSPRGVLFRQWATSLLQEYLVKGFVMDDERLMDHQGEFRLLVQDRLGKKAADAIDWSAPRLICIAAEFTKFDGYAVQQIDRNIELLRYRLFDRDLLLLEQVNAVTAETPSGKRPPPVKRIGTDKTVAEWLADMPPDVGPIFDALAKHIMSLGDDIQRKDLKLYVAFKRLRNFATVCFQKTTLTLYLHVDPITTPTEEGFIRDVREVGHWGTGDLEVTLRSLTELEKAKPLLAQAYEGRVNAG